MNDVEREVRAFISNNFLLTDAVGEFAGDTSLTRGGIIDSVGVVELLHFLETRFEIEIADEETIPENVDTVNNIVSYLERKRAAKGLAERPHATL